MDLILLLSHCWDSSVPVSCPQSQLLLEAKRSFSGPDNLRATGELTRQPCNLEKWRETEKRTLLSKMFKGLEVGWSHVYSPQLTVETDSMIVIF